MTIWVYPITWIILVAFTTNSLFNRKSNTILFLRKNWRKINIGFGLLFLALDIYFISYIFSHGGYFRFLIGDICVFIGVAYAPLLLFSKNKNNIFMKSLTPWSFGATFVLLISFLDNPFKNPTVHEGILGYSLHAMLLAYGLFYFQIAKKYTKREIWLVAAFAPFLITFILLTSGIALLVTGEDKYALYTSAFFKQTYKVHDIVLSSGRILHYSNYSFFGNLPMPYPIPTLIMYVLGLTLSLSCAKILPALVSELLTKKSIAKVKVEKFEKNLSR